MLTYLRMYLRNFTSKIFPIINKFLCLTALQMQSRITHLTSLISFFQIKQTFIYMKQTIFFCLIILKYINNETVYSDVNKIKYTPHFFFIIIT